MTRGRIIIAMAFVYLAVLLYVALWPTPVEAPVGAQIVSVVDALHRSGFPDWLGYKDIEIVANVLLFAPLAIFVDTVRRTNPWSILALGISISVTIELLQLVLSPHRFATLSDVVANTAGTALGIGILWLRSPRPRTLARGVRSDTARSHS